MATRKPLVLVSGQIQQLQSGDTIGLTSEVGQIAQVADADMVIGCPVYASAAGHINKARANAAATSVVTGLLTAGVSNGGTVIVQNGGFLTLTTGQWDAICGTTGGLTYGTDYYLSASSAGVLTSTAPSTGGQYIRPVIRAISTTEAEILSRDPILL